MVTGDLIDTSPIPGWTVEEEEGQMSAMFVMLSMGLFEMDGGCSVSPGCDTGSPVFDKIVIHLDKKYYGGGDFVIRTVNDSPRNLFIRRATLNGKSLVRPFLRQSEVVKGGEPVLEMGPAPDYDWGTK
jgi:putative alpha-1,2-mannosidase